MKHFLILLIPLSLLANDKKAEKFADQFRKNQRSAVHIIEKWTAHCKGFDMIPDPTNGCVKPNNIPPPEQKPVEQVKPTEKK